MFVLKKNDRLFLLADFTVVHNTVTFANLPRHGERMLILSHREELVEQPRKYFDCTYGVGTLLFYVPQMSYAQNPLRHAAFSISVGLWDFSPVFSQEARAIQRQSASTVWQ